MINNMRERGHSKWLSRSSSVAQATPSSMPSVTFHAGLGVLSGLWAMESFLLIFLRVETLFSPRGEREML
jgi:hypothetical protein